MAGGRLSVLTGARPGPLLECPAQELAPSNTSVFFGNGMHGRVRGLELWGTFQATSRWRLHGGLSRLWQDLELVPGGRDVGASVAAAEGSNPSRQWLLRSSFDLARQHELHATVRYVSELPTPPVPSYHAVDLRWAWRPRSDLELSVTGQNLFGPSHGEFANRSFRTEFERAVFVKLVGRF
jgi:iron complex outermembrane receptor protein